MFSFHKTARTIVMCVTVLMAVGLLPYGIQPTRAAEKPDHHFGSWLKEYIPAEYPGAQYIDYGHWFQARIPGGLFVSWAQLNEKDMTLKKVRAMTEGKSFFIDKGMKNDWADNAAVTYFKGAGTYCSGYASATMSDWNVEKRTVVQFDGDAKIFTDKMAKAWVKAQNPTSTKPGQDHVAKTNLPLKRMRVVMSTDFPPVGVVKGGNVPNTQISDPGDLQSMIRFLLYANEFDIEGLVTSAATFANQAKKQNMLDVLDRYEMVYDNLKKHDPLYPTADYLRSVTFEGRSGTWGKSVSNNIGAGKDSEASEAIIRIIDEPDPRPVWIGVWGDCSNVAQAIWKVKNTRSTDELETFLGKMRIHQISHQDGTIDWLLNNFPQLFIVYSKNTFQGMFGGSDPISDLAWVNKNIRQDHGPLGAVYPHEGMGCTGVCEGDSPSFLILVSAMRGLNDPEDPTQPSWGGQFKRVGSTNHYVDGPGRSSVSRWRPQYQAEFAERADWMLP